MFFFRSNNASPDTPSTAKSAAHKSLAQEADERARFSAYAEESGLPPASEWPGNSDLLVLPSHRARGIEYQVPCTGAGSDGESSLSVLPMDGSAVPFDGPHFKGTLVSRMRDVPTRDAPHGEGKMTNREYFRDRSRQYQWSVQGMA